MFYTAILIGCSCFAGNDKVVILGDSYSTFEGAIPERYANWYWTDSRGNDVHNVQQTWWWQLCRDKNLELLLNSSYSGSTICNTGYYGQDYSRISFVARMKNDIVGEDGKIGRCGQVPDLVLIFGGTNDDWSGAPMGEVLDPSEWKNADLKACLPATSYMLGYLKEKLPQTRIVVIVNSELKKPVTEGLEEACRLYGAECLKLFQIDKINNHPSVAGMIKIANQIGAAL